MVTTVLTLFSPYELLLGIKISNNNTEYLDEYGPTKFFQFEIGLIFIHFRVTKYYIDEGE
jgi:hypothetical protein